MKANIIKITAITLLLAGSYSPCTKDRDQVDFIRIGSGIRGIEPAQDKIITSQEEWENFVRALEKYETDRFIETEINFDNYMIIAIVDEVRPSTGWSIFITDITEYPDKVVIFVDVKAPKGIAYFMLTRPYSIVKMPVTAKNIEFRHIK